MSDTHHSANTGGPPAPQVKAGSTAGEATPDHGDASEPDPTEPAVGGQPDAGPPTGGRGWRAPGTRQIRRRTGRKKTGQPKAPSRAGRNLPAATAVGVALLGSVLGGILYLPLAFVAITTAFALVGVWEVSRALEVRQIRLPLAPTIGATIALPFAAYLGGPEALAYAVVFSTTILALWRSLDPTPDAARSIMAGVFVVLWVPLLLSFAMLLLQEPSGKLLVATLLLLVVANDTFGYLVGAFFGKHAMAPKISPKKSWEGFAGSVGGAVVVGMIAAVFLLDRPWWFGLILAVATVSAATAGDLAESMIKRELGVKDMGNILPGHGGMMDRLDSIVFASPVAFVLSVTLVPGFL
ncbi:phosphatidate cytidylyltransferase [Arthrobacter sp. CAN_A212]|uniref:phosphatidate cytidylyltransferase n=1 Tax=unclassified Arthrobacter TaxID=235627 RepID=UPI001A34A304|nr:phosphatidate cytidylyltransferase [Arthrobacter sp. CAN_C5]MBP2217602.1 phosphatidate cytidylyltransferase [Arthrobacter sp. CAN_C5]